MKALHPALFIRLHAGHHAPQAAWLGVRPLEDLLGGGRARALPTFKAGAGRGGRRAVAGGGSRVCGRGHRFADVDGRWPVRGGGG